MEYPPSSEEAWKKNTRASCGPSAPSWVSSFRVTSGLLAIDAEVGGGEGDHLFLQGDLRCVSA